MLFETPRIRAVSARAGPGVQHAGLLDALVGLYGLSKRGAAGAECVRRELKVLDLDAWAAAHDERPAHHVSKLPHVAGPVVLAKPGQGGVAEARRPGLRRQEPVAQKLDVVRPVSQWRHDQRQHEQAMKQVFSKEMVPDRLFEVSVGRRHDPDLNWPLLGVADPPDGGRLEHSQKLGLKVQRQLSDLVEKERAPLAGLERPLSPGSQLSGETRNMTKTRVRGPRL